MVDDIVLNIKQKAFEFYEWNENDEIIHIKHIPKYKVSDDLLLDFINNIVKVDNEFLNLIKNKTDVYYDKNINKLKNSCILYNNDISIAFSFNNYGVLIGRSKLIFEESDEIVNENKEKNVTNIKYKKIKSCFYNKYLTRKEDYIKNNLKKNINEIYKEKDNFKIKYLYYEIFDCDEKSLNEMYNVMIKYIEDSEGYKLKKLCKCIKLLK